MKLLLTGALNYSENQIKRLEKIGFKCLFIQDERVPLEIDVSDIEAVVCNALFMYNDISKFKSLKFIQLTSAGLDRVPIKYIEDKNITLYNAKGVYNIPMAEWVILKILEIYKKSKLFYEAQNNNVWEKQRDLLELNNKTATIVGYGDVGKEVAKRLKAFGVKVIGVGRRQIYSQLLDEYFLFEQLNDALKGSHIVILTLPLTDETAFLIDFDRISVMKNNSILVNVSRGGIVDEFALIQALKQKKFLGVALDVFEKEPLDPHSPLWFDDRVLITPHNSFVSDNTSYRLFKLIEKNLQKVITNIIEV